MNHRGMLPVLLALLGGCTTFQGGRPLEVIPAPIPPTQRIEVWSARERWQLHAVTLDADSLRGVRWWHAPDCDSCQVVLARPAIDSVRTLRYDGGQTGALLLMLTPVAFVVWFVNGLKGT